MTHVLAVDLGRTGCRASVWARDAAKPRAVATGEGSVGLTAENGPDVALQAIISVVAPLLGDLDIGLVDAACVGAAGALTTPDAAHRLASRLVDSIPARAVAVTSDAITSHAGALGGEPGVVLAAGTGAVTIALGADGEFRGVDGWGPWLGDEGSGAWLGREGLRAAARAADGRGPATSLHDAALARFGPLPALAAELGSDPNPARTLAAFAPDVAAAARSGDAAATRLMQETAAALAGSILAGAAALPGMDAIPVALVGGLIDIGPVLLEPLRAHLQQGDARIELRAARGTANDGAHWLATHCEGIHESRVVRTGRDGVDPATFPTRAEKNSSQGSHA